MYFFAYYFLWLEVHSPFAKHVATLAVRLGLLAVDTKLKKLQQSTSWDQPDPYTVRAPSPNRVSIVLLSPRFE